MTTCRAPSECRQNGYASVCGRGILGCLYREKTDMTDKTEWLVILTQTSSGKRDSRAVWASHKDEAVKQALRLLPDLTWMPTHAVQMTAEDEEAIADMEWYKDIDDEEEVELDREREKFDTFRIG